MILINSIYLLTCKVAYAIEGLHSDLTVIDLNRKTKWGANDHPQSGWLGFYRHRR